MVALIVSSAIAATSILAQPKPGDDDDSAEEPTPSLVADADLDAVPDALDECPLTPENLNGYLDYDGCPDQIPTQQQVQVQEPDFILTEMMETAEEDDDTVPEPTYVPQTTKDKVEARADDLDKEILEVLNELLETDPGLAEEMLRELEMLTVKKGD